MADAAKKRFDRQFEKLRSKLPGPIARHLGWMREPSARWIRIPAAILLIVGGFLGFLPILGFWMIPLGVLLLAQDIPFLRGPAGRALVWLHDRARRWRRRGPPRTPSPEERQR